MILRQLIGALLRRIGRGRPRRARAPRCSPTALRQAADAATPPSGEPVEGTILTVARAAADAAAGDGRRRPERPARDRDRRGGRRRPREALARTPEQLQVLRDAGRRRRRRPRALRGPRRRRDRRSPGGAGPLDRAARHRGAIPVAPARPATSTADGPAYEVMYLLDADDDGDPARCARASPPLGDSLVVVGGEGLWNVHVHVDDVGAAIEAGIEAGRPHRIRVTHFAEQVERRAGDAARSPRRTGRAAGGRRGRCRAGDAVRRGRRDRGPRAGPAAGRRPARSWRRSRRRGAPR